MGDCWEYALEAIIKWFISIFMFMIIVYSSCYNLLTGNIIHVWNINNQLSLVSLNQTGSLAKRWLEFPNHGLVIVS